MTSWSSRERRSFSIIIDPFRRPLPAYRSRDTSLELWRPCRNVVVERAPGHATAAAVAHLQRRSTLLVDGVRLTVFGDRSKMTGYEANARQGLMHWAQAHRVSLDGIHLGVTRGYSNAANWRSALDAAVERATRV